MRDRRKSDYWIWVTVIIISILGLVMVYSSSWPQGIADYNDGGKFFKSQIFAFGIGLLGMTIFSQFISYRIFKGWITEALFFTALILNILVRFISEPVNGAYRWIELPLGFSFMPSDILKISMVIMAAKYLSDPKKFQKNHPVKGFIPALLFLGGPLGILVVLQSDLGTGGALGIALFMMYIASAVKALYPFLMGVLGILGGAAMVLVAPYRMKRLTTFIDPFADKQGQGWQVVQSLYAIGSGGLFGVGLGQSRQKYYYLPFAYSDFIFAIFAEEFGLIGSLILIGLYLTFLIRGMRVAILVEDRFGKLLAYGISIIIFVQTMIHIAVASSAIPTTGITMPLFSHGGTSLIVTMVQIGILLNVSKNIPSKEARKDKKARKESSAAAEI